MIQKRVAGACAVVIAFFAIELASVERPSRADECCSIRAPVMPSVHFNESAISATDIDTLMKTPLNNALIPALNREHLQSTGYENILDAN